MTATYEIRVDYSDGYEIEKISADSISVALAQVPADAESTTLLCIVSAPILEPLIRMR